MPGVGYSFSLTYKYNLIIFRSIPVRSPGRRRPMPKSISPPKEVDLTSVADRVRYVGSPEHKDMPSFAGHPRLRADASICPRELTRDQKRVDGWLREAIRRGAVSELWVGGFPRYVWYKDGDQIYEARLVNQGSGEYKGYPLGAPDEWPRGIEELYG